MGLRPAEAGDPPKKGNVQLTPRLDFNLVALAEADQLTLMLELTAPPATTYPARPPAAIEVVLDRSRSMHESRLRIAVDALHRLVGWLEADDQFGLVSFAAEPEVVVPAGPVSDKREIWEAIARIRPDDGSNLSTGYVAGIGEAGSMIDEHGVTVVVVSDGLANLGALRTWEVERLAANARRRGITTSTLAIGSGADGRLLSAVARGGSGAALAAASPDLAAALLAGEIDGLLQPAVQSLSLAFHPVPSARSLTVLTDGPVCVTETGPIVDLGDLHHGETRYVIAATNVTATEKRTEVTLGEVTLQYLTLPSLVPHTSTLTLTVLPTSDATPQVADPAVASEGARPGGE